MAQAFHFKLISCDRTPLIGGAGTTSAGLRYGLPTLVCPFFGDQFMVSYYLDLNVLTHSMHI